MSACKDCKWVKEINWILFKFYNCTHPKCRHEVSGRPVSCELSRLSPCTFGKFFESKTEPPKETE